jgi:serine protease Do
MMVKSVAKGSPAETSGLRPGTMPATIDGQEIVLGGDIILEAAEIPVGGPDAYFKIRSRINSLPPNSTFTIKFLRAGSVLETTMRVP